MALIPLLVSAVLAMSSPPANALLGADASIQGSASPTPVEVGQVLTLTLTVRNEGGANADAVTVADVLVSSLDLMDAVSTLGSCSGSTTVLCSLGTMAPGQTATITLHVTPNAPGQVVNTASVAALLDADPSDNAAVTTVDVLPAGGGGGGGLGVADLSIAMMASPDPGAVGSPLRYSITVTNDGPAGADPVTMVDTPPAGVNHVQASASQGSCSVGAVVTCDLGAIDAGSNATVTVTVEPTSEGTVMNATSATSLAVDLDPTDNAAVVSTVVGPADGGGSGSGSGSGECTIEGTSGADVLRGTSAPDVLCGLGGDDLLVGLGGDDVLKGGGGNDVLKGGSGSDRENAGSGQDALKGGGGDDALKGGGGRDRFAGGGGDDRCVTRKREAARGCE